MASCLIRNEPLSSARLCSAREPSVVSLMSRRDLPTSIFDSQVAHARPLHYPNVSSAYFPAVISRHSPPSPYFIVEVCFVDIPLPSIPRCQGTLLTSDAVSASVSSPRLTPSLTVSGKVFRFVFFLGFDPRRGAMRNSPRAGRALCPVR